MGPSQETVEGAEAPLEAAEAAKKAEAARKENGGPVWVDALTQSKDRHYNETNCSKNDTHCYRAVAALPPSIAEGREETDEKNGENKAHECAQKFGDTAECFGGGRCSAFKMVGGVLQGDPFVLSVPNKRREEGKQGADEREPEARIPQERTTIQRCD